MKKIIKKESCQLRSLIALLCSSAICTETLLKLLQKNRTTQTQLEKNAYTSGQFILRKISKIGTARFQILRQGRGEEWK